MCTVSTFLVANSAYYKHFLQSRLQILAVPCCVSWGLVSVWLLSWAYSLYVLFSLYRRRVSFLNAWLSVLLQDPSTTPLPFPMHAADHQWVRHLRGKSRDWWSFFGYFCINVRGKNCHVRIGKSSKQHIIEQNTQEIIVRSYPSLMMSQWYYKPINWTY